MARVSIVAILLFSTSIVFAQTNRIDIIRHDAPELAKFGNYNIGVRTLDIIDKDRVDVLATKPGEANAIYDRKLTIEIWYPATLKADQVPGGQYQAMTRNPSIIATLHGRAVRDAAPLRGDTPYPLVVISHGYPGNRYLMSHLGENLASKGYVVASIDHTDSTYDDQQAFPSTLYNRPLDQRFVIETMAQLNNSESGFLKGMVDANRTGVVGYSMGGYGLVNNLGAGYNDTIAASALASPNALLSAHASGNPEYRANLDSRIKAGFAIGPWGMGSGFWSKNDLKGIKVPAFYLAGDADNVSGYANGTRAIFEGAVNSDRYLLTFKNAGHNAGAPYPLPIEIANNDNKLGASHYTDPVWDNVRMNNIMDHFATAFFDYYLKNETARKSYLNLIPDGADGVYSIEDGKASEKHTYWKGFSAGGAVGLKLEHLSNGK